jgi:5-methylcytosine-specific restriction protein A
VIVPLTIAEAARIYRVPAGTIRRWLAKGVLQSLTKCKPHRVNAADVEELVKKHAARRSCVLDSGEQSSTYGSECLLMPRAPRLCSFAGCLATATTGSRCDTHKRDVAAERRARGREDNRPTSSQRGYGAEWRKLRALVLREEPTCRRCSARSTVVDHVIPKARGGTDERRNLQGLCERCHNRKTVTEDGGYVFGMRRGD